MAWGVRQLGAAQALGAPKGYSKPAPKAKLPMQPQKANAGPKHNANPHHGVPGQDQHAHPGPTGGGESLPLVQLSQPQLQHRALKLAQAQGQTELAPLRNQATELSATEQAAQNRFKGYAEAQQGNLAQLGQQAEASAKTAQNQAADNALKAGQSIETSGQAQAGLTGGYLSPELRAELQAEGQKTAATGAAGNSLAAQSSQNETNLMNNLRAAAVAKATEGSSQIASQYGKALRENTAKQGEVAGRQGANYLKNVTELGSKQFNQKATEAGLGIKTQTLAQKGQETAAKNRVAVRGQNVTAANNLRTTATSRENSERTAQTSRQNKQADLVYKETHPTGTKSTTPKAPSPAEGRKYMQSLSHAISIAKAAIGGTNQGRGTHATQTAARAALAKEGATADQISAALNLAVYGRLGPNDRKAAEAYGLTPAMRPAWFRSK